MELTNQIIQNWFAKKWTDIQGTIDRSEPRKDNQSQSLERPCRIS